MTCSKIYFKLSVNAASCGRQGRFAMHGLEDQYFLIWVSKTSLQARKLILFCNGIQFLAVWAFGHYQPLIGKKIIQPKDSMLHESAPFVGLNLAEKHYSGWIVVREKHCSGWKKKPNKLAFVTSQTAPCLNRQWSNFHCHLIRLCHTGIIRGSGLGMACATGYAKLGRAKIASHGLAHGPRAFCPT